MFNALASLAQRRGKRVVIAAIILFGVAGALGSSVADRLDPYGADDPETESIQANDRLEAAGYRDASVIVLVENAPADSAAGRKRVNAIHQQVAADPDVAGVTSYYSTGSRDFVSNDGRSSYLAVSLHPTGYKQRQDAAERIEESLADAEGVSVGGYSLAEAQVNETVEK